MGKKTVNPELQQLRESVSDVAKLVTRPSERKVGLRNYGSDSWITDNEGRQFVLKHGMTAIVNQPTFIYGVMPRSLYTDGHIVRDDSVLTEMDVPCDQSKSVINAIFDEGIADLLGDEKKALSLIGKLTSTLTIQRFMDAARKKGRSKYATIISACEDRLFVMSNHLPENFWLLDFNNLKTLIKKNGWPEKLANNEDGSEGTSDDVRSALVSYLTG